MNGRNAYDEIYRDGRPPWDIGAPQPALAKVLDDGVTGPKVLDIGCGPGGLAIALARRGYDVTAVDISAVAIDLARARAAREGVVVHFRRISRAGRILAAYGARGQCWMRPPVGTAATCPLGGSLRAKASPTSTSEDRRRRMTSGTGVHTDSAMSPSGSGRNSPPVMRTW